MAIDRERTALWGVIGGLTLGVVIGWLLGRDRTTDPPVGEMDTEELVAELRTEHATTGLLIEELGKRAGQEAMELDDLPDDVLDFELDEDDIELDDDIEIGDDIELDGDEGDIGI
jgi:hypothetical protein